MICTTFKTTPAIGQRPTQRGMTLIEMMVAMAISSILLLGSINIYTQTRSSYRTTESVAHLQENIRFAADTMANDIQLAQFWGPTNESGGFEIKADVTIRCETADVTDWALDVNVNQPGIARVKGIEASDDGYDLDGAPCPGSDPREDSDVLVVRHASAVPIAAPANGHVQIQSYGEGATIFSTDLIPNPAAVDGALHDVIVNAYYISNQSKYDASLPALRRRSLVGDVMQDQEIIPGVENMQVQLGIDTTGDGAVDSYVDSDLAADDDPIHSVRLWLLVRSEMTEQGQGYQDTKTYVTPDADLADITPATDANYPAEFRRRTLTKTIYLRNM